MFREFQELIHVTKASTFFMMHQNFQSSFFIDHTPSLWDRNKFFVKCLFLLKRIHKNSAGVKRNKIELEI